MWSEFQFIFDFQAQMMEESPEATAKREDMLKMYHACKESLRIIGMCCSESEILKSKMLIFMSALLNLKVMFQWQQSLRQFHHQLRMIGSQVEVKIQDYHHQVLVDQGKLLPFSR